MELNRPGPGLLLRDIASGNDPQVMAVTEVLASLDADVVLLVGMDWDAQLLAAQALAGRLAQAGATYPELQSLRPNTGQPTGLDLDRNGRLGEARDAQGWGRFPGEGGMLLLSRLPLDRAAARDFSSFLWADLPGALIPPETGIEERQSQRLATTGHWEVPVILPSGGRLTILAFAATPPVFDGPEDRNGRRNHDEAAFWLRLIEGRLADMGLPPPKGPLVLMGTGNLDPLDGEGRPEAFQALVAGAFLDPEPRGANPRADPQQRGDPALDTALFPKTGGLRVDYLLPSRGLAVVDAGVLWTLDGDALAPVLARASRHRPVWVEVEIP
ncbi:endonuclease/exonuclease/phosphatase family protein [Neotabrizicola shimadae]|uniref:Endonuclease/exonuclease/phosphatase family protein n=1 Tax=Neotabrizicola shimadae TaxID=2807096 RepID=A0A8G0ZZJ5_9RHOB|nr:endonuclease/exonuclease/phosphatase family protein [Neotabrizicola shimadae]QYZ72000.1 endonuclease/exonuclease/phosphatase family protein [Neotabrizicola shimadae]